MLNVVSTNIPEYIHHIIKVNITRNGGRFTKISRRESLQIYIETSKYVSL